MQLTIVVPNGDNNISSITGSYEIFNKANQYWKALGRRPVFSIQVAGVSKKVAFSSGLFTVQPHLHIKAIQKSHLIIVPSLNHNYQTAVKGNTALINWIAQQYKDGAAIASICTGAFLLAAAGLLDGKSCSTHWSVAGNFKKMFPEVRLQTD